MKSLLSPILKTPLRYLQGRRLQVERLSQSFQEAVQRYSNIQKVGSSPLQCICCNASGV